MQIPARSAPLVKIAIFDSITSKYYYIFKNLTSTKIFKNSRFFYVSYGKNTGNKTFLIFGPFLAISGKIQPKFCHRFARPYIFTWPLLCYAAEESASWEHCHCQLAHSCGNSCEVPYHSSHPLPPLIR
jgi:hypothetical protein